MGARYRTQLETKIDELGVDNIVAFIEPGSFSSEYEEHLRATLLDRGVAITDECDSANLLFAGYSDTALTPPRAGCMTAVISAHELVFAGSL